MKAHWHVWEVSAETRRAAFLSRSFTSRSAANAYARRVGDRRWRFVQKCGFGSQCPRPPKEVIAE